MPLNINASERDAEALVDGLKIGTGASDERIVIGIPEVPASQAMEMGEGMSDVWSLIGLLQPRTPERVNLEGLP